MLFMFTASEAPSLHVISLREKGHKMYYFTLKLCVQHCVVITLHMKASGGHSQYQVRFSIYCIIFVGLRV